MSDKQHSNNVRSRSSTCDSYAQPRGICARPYYYHIGHLSHYTYVTEPPMPVRYLHGTPRTDLTHSAGVHTPTRVCATRRILPLLVSHPLLSAHALGRSVGHERERFASLRSRVIRDVTMSVTSLPEYPAQTVRRKLGR